MFERFSERARQVVVLAQEEARRLRHNYIGTEHLLLALLSEGEGVASRALTNLDITLEEARAQVARVVGPGDEVVTGQIPFTPRAKKVLELSLREAMRLGHDYIGTEHLLLGIAREDAGVAAQILRGFDAGADTIRSEVIRVLSGPPRGAAGAAAAEAYGGEGTLRPEWEGVSESERASRPQLDPDRLRFPLVVAIVLAAVGFPLGLFVGWLVWGA